MAVLRGVVVGMPNRSCLAEGARRRDGKGAKEVKKLCKEVSPLQEVPPLKVVVPLQR